VNGPLRLIYKPKSFIEFTGGGKKYFEQFFEKKTPTEEALS
jgi:hypothetical protein